MPDGVDITEPPPLPAIVTSIVDPPSSKVGVTVTSPVTANVQSPVPLHPPPDQPANDEPAAGVACRVTRKFSANASLQSLPQSIPAGDDVTVPSPLPDTTIVTT